MTATEFDAFAELPENTDNLSFWNTLGERLSKCHLIRMRRKFLPVSIRHLGNWVEVYDLGHVAGERYAPDVALISKEKQPELASEPEPDGMTVRGERRQYGKRHPTAQDVVLVVEVADLTLQRD
jgi:hypothetical protein